MKLPLSKKKVNRVNALPDTFSALCIGMCLKVVWPYHIPFVLADRSELVVEHWKFLHLIQS